MAWAIWLAAPIVTTTAAALWVWWRGRPPRQPSVANAMRVHDDYLAALTMPARGTARAEPPLLGD